MKALVLGATGMLGDQVFQQLSQRGIETLGTTRRSDEDPRELVPFDAAVDSIEDLLDSMRDITHVINAIGIIKPYIKDGVSEQEVVATKINALFPHFLANTAKTREIKVIQIATDCVFSGEKGAYTEQDPHDALDVYGKSKSLGEVRNDNVMHLRCSIIGREIGRSTSLVEWVNNQELNSQISGYTNHLWNGVTTNVFGMLCAGAMENNFFEPGVLHVVPKDIVDKQTLVSDIAKALGRSDIVVSPTLAPVAVDRTLSTINQETNHIIWKNAGFISPPTIDEIVRTLSFTPMIDSL